MVVDTNKLPIKKNWYLRDLKVKLPINYQLKRIGI